MDSDRRGLRMARVKEWESPVSTPPAMSGASAPKPSFLDSLQPSGPPKNKAIDEAVTEASPEASELQQTEDDRTALREVKPGKAFTVSSHNRDPGSLLG
jgi:hypothetical protein